MRELSCCEGTPQGVQESEARSGSLRASWSRRYAAEGMIIRLSGPYQMPLMNQA
jgi:starvation-inducible outer membrane lipoprotein